MLCNHERLTQDIEQLAGKPRRRPLRAAPSQLSGTSIVNAIMASSQLNGKPPSLSLQRFKATRRIATKTISCVFKRPHSPVTHRTPELRHFKRQKGKRHERALLPLLKHNSSCDRRRLLPLGLISTRHRVLTIVPNGGLARLQCPANHHITFLLCHLSRI
jgi:hypothetical protein